SYLDVICHFTLRPPPPLTLFPYTTLFRSVVDRARFEHRERPLPVSAIARIGVHQDRNAPVRIECQEFRRFLRVAGEVHRMHRIRSEEHTSELQSRENLVCRLLLEKKKAKA